MNGYLLAALEPSALDARVVLWPLLLGLGVYLLLSSAAARAPSRDLGERLRALDVDERLNEADRDRAACAAAVHLADAREHVAAGGRGCRAVAAACCSGSGVAVARELEQRLRVARPGVEVVQFVGEKVADGLICRGVVSDDECAAHRAVRTVAGVDLAGRRSASVSCCPTGT